MTVSGTKKKAGLAERLSQNSVFLSGAALVLSLIVAGIVMLIAGYSPIEGYSAMFTGAFGNVSNLAQTLGTATPLIFAGLAMAFAARGGMFNIGIEGQIIGRRLSGGAGRRVCAGPALVPAHSALLPGRHDRRRRLGGRSPDSSRTSCASARSF